MLLPGILLLRAELVSGLKPTFPYDTSAISVGSCFAFSTTISRMILRMDFQVKVQSSTRSIMEIYLLFHRSLEDGLWCVCCASI